MTLASIHDFAAALPAPQLSCSFACVSIEAERPDDRVARERLLDQAFGPARFGKTCERLRTGRQPATGLSLVARAREHGLGGCEIVASTLVGSVRLWHVDAGGVPALMLGPLAIDAHWRSHGIGARLMEAAIESAATLGHGAILLVGDAPYYVRFGFLRVHAVRLRMPGPVEAERFLGLELTPGAFAAARGLVRATGAVDLSVRRGRKPRLRRAA